MSAIKQETSSDAKTPAHAEMFPCYLSHRDRLKQETA